MNTGELYANTNISVTGLYQLIILANQYIGRDLVFVPLDTSSPAVPPISILRAKLSKPSQSSHPTLNMKANNESMSQKVKQMLYNIHKNSNTFFETLMNPASQCLDRLAQKLKKLLIMLSFFTSAFGSKLGNYTAHFVKLKYTVNTSNVNSLPVSQLPSFTLRIARMPLFSTVAFNNSNVYCTSYLPQILGAVFLSVIILCIVEQRKTLQ